MRITAEMLRAKRACEEQVARFEREWPEGTDLTLPAAMRAVALDLDLNWFAETFLRGPERDEYQKVRAAAFVAAWEMQSKEASDDN